MNVHFPPLIPSGGFTSVSTEYSRVYWRCETYVIFTAMSGLLDQLWFEVLCFDAPSFRTTSLTIRSGHQELRCRLERLDLPEAKRSLHPLLSVRIPSLRV
jgi:hypothetical protein